MAATGSDAYYLDCLCNAIKATIRRRLAGGDTTLLVGDAYTIARREIEHSEMPR
ncbi:hypothetical protein [Changpingibacter yushuensis]|uniref:hypothetical protein n=1 Tax=Changpingibacter yushuensis TaxID=2758440 RepID=UPI0015F7128D|nr:hypothetical protein [Changpingibacter yushuensis]